MAQPKKPLTKKEQAELAMSDYIDCAVARGDRRATSSASATEIADAALAECGKEFAVMQFSDGG